jgi:RES domain-containing protein
VHAADTFSGEGPFRYGGRWNPPGVRLVYVAESRSLAAMEVLVHHIGTATFALTKWVVIPVDVPEALIERPTRVPDAWRVEPPSRTVQEFGAAWVRAGKNVALLVPSTVVLGEFNCLLNPAHTDYKRIRVGKPESFAFDSRITE